MFMCGRWKWKACQEEQSNTDGKREQGCTTNKNIFFDVQSNTGESLSAQKQAGWNNPLWKEQDCAEGTLWVRRVGTQALPASLLSRGARRANPGSARFPSQPFAFHRATCKLRNPSCVLALTGPDTPPLLASHFPLVKSSKCRGWITITAVPSGSFCHTTILQCFLAWPRNSSQLRLHETEPEECRI